jgi:hypothetical protein
MLSACQNSVEIKWDGLSPSESDIALMTSGVDLATEALEYIGLPQTAPKTMVICTSPKPDSAVAAIAEDAMTFKVYAHRTNDSLCLPSFKDVVRYISHERIHTDRFGYFPRDDEDTYILEERIAHEGLATYGEQAAMRPLLTSAEFADVYRSRISGNLVRSLKDAYLYDSDALTVVRQEDPDNYMRSAVGVLIKWYERAGQTKNTKVSLLGMIIVGNLVERGEVLSSLIKTPSPQIIADGMAGI